MNKLFALLLAIVIAAIWVFTARSADAKRANAGANDTLQVQVSASYEYEADVYLCSI